MSQLGIELAMKYRCLMTQAGFQNDNEFVDNFNPNNILHQQIQATRLAYFTEAKRVYGID